MITEIVGGASEGVYILSDEERAAIERSQAQFERGVFAIEEEFAAVFAKYRI